MKASSGRLFRILLTALFFFASANATAQVKNDTGDAEVARVLFYELKPLGDFPADQSQIIENFILAKLHEYKKFNVISRKDVEGLLDAESLRQILDCDSTFCWAEMGGALGMKYVLSGDVGKMGENALVVTLRLVDPQEMKVLSRVTQQLPGDLGQGATGITIAVNKLIADVDPHYGSLLVTSPPPPALKTSGGAKSDSSFYSQWWFWPTVAAVAGGVVAGVYLLNSDSDASGEMGVIKGDISFGGQP